MESGLGTSAFGQEQIYTLVQSETTKVITSANKKEITVNGKGTVLGNDEVLMRRTKKKTITQKMVLSLIDVAKKKEEPEREKSYWNTYHCQSRIFSSNGRLYGKYCKNRFCTICCGIRKAEIMNKYLPVIKTWPEPYFTTLTIKGVPAHRLSYMINGIVRGFKRIKNKLRKRHQRGKGIRVYGIRSLECNFNPAKRTYNPHFHIIFPNKEVADLFTKEWLLLFTEKFTYKGAQFSRKVESTERDLIEIVKYGSKIFTEPDLKKKSKQKTSPYIYVSALDNILSAMKKHRIFERFGFDLPESPKKDKMSEQLNKYEEWVFDPQQSDWVNSTSNEPLTNYTLPPELRTLLANNINTEIE